MLWETVPKRNEDRADVSPADFLDWRERSTKFEDLAAFEWWDVNLTGIGEPERLQGTYVSPGFLDDLGVKTVLGRTLGADRQSFGAKTVVLSYRLYARRFGADPAVVGQSIVRDGEQYTVVGVAQPGFEYPNGSDLWAPLWFDAQTAALRDHYYLDVIGKIKPGVSFHDVSAELDVIGKRLEREHPATNEGRGVRALSLERSVVDLGSPTFLALLQTATVFVLLIACVNVANLLLARGADREKEISLRQALGAGRARIVRQLLTENLLVAIVGAAAALPLAWVAIGLMRGGLPPEIQRFVVGWREIGLDFRVLAFTASVTLLTTLLFGLIPALRASRSDLTASLKEGGRLRLGRGRKTERPKPSRRRGGRLGAHASRRLRPLYPRHSAARQRRSRVRPRPGHDLRDLTRRAKVRRGRKEASVLAHRRRRRARHLRSGLRRSGERGSIVRR
jgi:putative ABC transport system permease protein